MTFDDTLALAEGDAADRKFPGDRGRLTARESKALTYLMTNHYLSATGSEQGLYDFTLTHAPSIEGALNDLGYTLSVDDQYQVASATPVAFDGEDQPYKLKREMSERTLGKLTRYLIGRLAVQQTLLEAQGEERWFVTREELVDWMEQGGFLGGRDKDRRLRALDASLEKLKAFGFVARVEDGGWEMLPPLPSFMSPEAVDAWAEWFETHGRGAQGGNDDDGEGSPEPERSEE